MEAVKPVKIAVSVRDGSLADRLERTLRHWSETVCVLTARAIDAQNADILFLDADARIPPENALPALVMISADEARAIDAYQYHPAAFLKPAFTAADFRAAMSRCFPAWRDALNCLRLPGGREPSKLPMGGIRYVEACGRESVVYCDDASFTVPAPMGKLVQQLPDPPFFRCQRSFIVHMSAVLTVSDGNLVMAQDRRLIPVSRKRADEFREALAHWNALEGANPNA